MSTERYAREMMLEWDPEHHPMSRDEMTQWLEAHLNCALRLYDAKELTTSDRTLRKAEINLDGYVDSKGIRYLGVARRQPDGKWLCLADVAGTLCRVEVTITPEEIVGISTQTRS